MNEQKENEQEEQISTGLEEDAPDMPTEVKETEVVAVAEIENAGAEINEDARDRAEQLHRSGVNPHATLSKPFSSPLPRNTDLEDDVPLAVINADQKELDAILETYPNVNFVKGAASQTWAQIIATGAGSYMADDAFMGSVTRDESEWKQSIPAGSVELAAGRPAFGEQNEGGLLTGEQAVMRVQMLMGLGSTIRVPLWHTGLWLTLKAPTVEALVELDRRISSEKIRLGRETNGLVFSNTSVYTNSYIVDFILAHLYEVNYSYSNVKELKDVILTTDLPTVIWAMTVAMYPNGYPFRLACVTNPMTCRHVEEAMLALSKLSFTDDRSLTQAQRKHMLNKTNKVSKEKLALYQADHRYQKLAHLNLRAGLSIEWKVPTLSEYEYSGRRWVDDIVSRTDEAFSMNLSENERMEYINYQGRVTALREYGHWIAKIVVDGNKEIVDTDTIDDVISTLTSDEESYKAFFNNVRDYIDETTISLIAIPRYNCPSCGEPMSPEEKKHPHLMPVDPTNIFFTVLGRRIIKSLQLSQTRGR